MEYEMIIETPEQIHALSHPLRQRILSLLYYQELTNKQLAEKLEETPAKVYFHVKELLNAGFIHLTKEKPNKSIIEKYYSTSAHSFRLSPTFEFTKFDKHILFESTFQETYRTFVDSFYHYDGSMPNTKISHQTVSLSKKDMEKIEEHLSSIDQLIQSASKKYHSKSALDNLSPFSFSYFFHPSVPNKKDERK